MRFSTEMVKQPKGAKVYTECIHFTRPDYGYNFSLDYKIFPTLKALRQHSDDNFELSDPGTLGFFSSRDSTYIGRSDNKHHHDLGYVALVVNAPNWMIAHESTHVIFEVARQFTPYKLLMISKTNNATPYEEDFCSLMEMLNFVPQDCLINARKFFRSRRIKFETTKSRSYREYEDRWDHDKKTK